MFQFVISQLSEYPKTALKLRVNRLAHFNQWHPSDYIDMTGSLLLPYEILCISHVMSCYPVSELYMPWCHIWDKGAELLVKYYPCKNCTGQLLEVLNLVLLLGDLMVSATWLANPSFLTIFLPMVLGDSGLISSKRWSSSCRYAICWNSCLQIVSSYYCLCLWWYLCVV